MKVSNNKVGGAGGNVEGAKAARAESAPGPKKDLKTSGMGNAAKGGSKIEMSERAQMMQKAKDIAGKSTVDETKVARLQKMIDEGKYKVDSESVADRLVDEHLLIPD